LKKYGSHTVVSYLINVDVGIEKTSGAISLCQMRVAITVDLLKGKPLGLGNPQEDPNQCDDVEGSVEADYMVKLAFM
jgi:hypothetical protein